ncbi:MAG: hypothetical protein GC181_04355 [Bacteroidetes bacterium]|nr:hypothetical protein [Bacteroidota bacterium]
MRKLLVLVLFLTTLSASSQNYRHPFEVSIGLNLLSNRNTLSYDASMLSAATHRNIKPETFSKIFWNSKPTIIREYMVGCSQLIKNSGSLQKEWIFSLDISAQFRHHHIFSGKKETLVEEQVIDSVFKSRNFDSELINITEFNDVIFVKPSLVWKIHLNRRWNLKSEGGLGIGVPVKAGFEIMEAKGKVERQYANNNAISEEQFFPSDQVERTFVSMPMYMALNSYFKPGMEYRLYEHRSVFLGASAVVGKQLTFNRCGLNSFGYTGGEVKIISRF